MSAKRKKWKVTYVGSDAVDQFTSEKATHEWLRSLANAPDSKSQRVQVWVDQGDGRWQLHDEEDLSEWAAKP
ncbi:hypothetical protein [Micromonospora carbonacea]|uniref:Uncharacterized protein n=1 Tax=Micromonospora carbonacea TaxID=47853 RepID=A0A1C5AAQ0_9ACTN|nr:hypothetical protein [Micromonospora carbonacea]SCF42303.1 hypothetical protein GA0070563_11263 [Micromonospora carbonacea]